MRAQSISNSACTLRGSFGDDLSIDGAWHARPGFSREIFTFG
jgi:hypothetical protein